MAKTLVEHDYVSFSDFVAANIEPLWFAGQGIVFPLTPDAAALRSVDGSGFIPLGAGHNYSQYNTAAALKIGAFDPALVFVDPLGAEQLDGRLAAQTYRQFTFAMSFLATPKWELVYPAGKFFWREETYTPPELFPVSATPSRIASLELSQYKVSKIAITFGESPFIRDSYWDYDYETEGYSAVGYHVVRDVIVSFSDTPVNYTVHRFLDGIYEDTIGYIEFETPVLLSSINEITVSLHYTFPPSVFPDWASYDAFVSDSIVYPFMAVETSAFSRSYDTWLTVSESGFVTNNVSLAGEDFSGLGDYPASRNYRPPEIVLFGEPASGQPQKWIHSPSCLERFTA